MKNKNMLDDIITMVGMSLNKTIDTVEQLEKMNNDISVKISEQKETVKRLEMAMGRLRRLKEENENENNQSK